LPSPAKDVDQTSSSSMHTVIGPGSGVRGRLSCECKSNPRPFSAQFYRPSHLNLIRSVTTILEIMNRVMKEQQDRVQRQQRSFSPSRPFRSPVASPSPEPSDESAEDPNYSFSDKHKMLQLQLQPLTRVRRDLEKHLGPATLEPDQVPTTSNVAFPDPDAAPEPPRHYTEFSVPVNSPWKARLSGNEGSKRVVEKKSFQDLHDATEILYRCGPNIKQLWADDVVQQVLKGTKTQLKHSSGL
jgi:hypothetical protein